MMRDVSVLFRQKRNFYWVECAVCCLFLAPLLSAYSMNTGSQCLQRTAVSTLQTAEQAYIYGYSLLNFYVTQQVSTNTRSPDPASMHAPLNQFVNMPDVPAPAFTTVVSPNADTLYSSAFLDLAVEPIVLHVPDTHGRYYLMPMLNAWTNVFASPGKRTTGTAAGDFVVVGPDWHGTLPVGLKQLRSSTDLVWIIGRTQVNGPADVPAVNTIRQQYSLMPLSAWGKPYTPPLGSVNPAIDNKTPPVQQVHNMDAATYFGTLASLLKTNPPNRLDGPMVAQLASLGIIPGMPFKFSSLDAAIQKTLQQAIPLAQQQITNKVANIGQDVNGWKYALDTGAYGTDYLFRAAVAQYGLGANLALDAVYSSAYADGAGRPLSGINRYLIHFNPGQTPPVNAFWSVTIYNQSQAFVANPINRYALGNHFSPLRYNADGSLDLYIQYMSPGVDKIANWLRAPQGNFNIVLRMYWPQPSVLDLTWKPPGLQMVEADPLIGVPGRG